MLRSVSCSKSITPKPSCGPWIQVKSRSFHTSYVWLSESRVLKEKNKFWLFSDNQTFLIRMSKNHSRFVQLGQPQCVRHHNSQYRRIFRMILKECESTLEPRQRHIWTSTAYRWVQNLYQTCYLLRLLEKHNKINNYDLKSEENIYDLRNILFGFKWVLNYWQFPLLPVEF